MNFANTLNEILRDNAKLDRSIFHHESGDSSREVTFAELHERALGLLHLLQHHPMHPNRLHLQLGQFLLYFLQYQFLLIYYLAILDILLLRPQ